MEKNGKKRILIVDDIPKNIQLAASFLKPEGYDIYFAQNGANAISHALEIVPDLILLDIMMPGMDGIEVCKKIKDNKKTSHIPIIFLTAKDDDQTISEGFKSGAVDYITKPFNAPELKARVRTHLQLRQREIQLEEINSAKDRLFSIIGHDLKTPLSNILSLGNLLINQKDILSDKEHKQLLDDIVESARQGLYLLENLLSWSRIQLGLRKTKSETIEISKVLKPNIDFIKPSADAKSINVIQKIKPNIYIHADLNFINTILRNLLSNAVKFTPPNGSIKIIVESLNSEVAIYVTDTGVGIPEDRIKKLFNPKETITTAGTQNEKGTGLGLALSNDLARILGGKLEVESKENEGSSFKLFLPVIKPEKS